MVETLEVVEGDVCQVIEPDEFESVDADNYLLSFKFGPIIINIGLISSHMRSYVKLNVAKVIQKLKALVGLKEPDIVIEG